MVIKSYTDIEQSKKLAEILPLDSAHLHSIITHLQDFIESHLNTTGADIQGENVAWLKSLKERYTWKPSEEQIKALKDALNDAIWQYDFKGSLIKEEVTRKHAEIIESLYNDLKKLREE